MSTQQAETSIYQLADHFINLANELSAQEQDVSKVSTALRYAAARFNAFEAALKSANLKAEKTNALTWFTQEYQEMLEENLDDHIQHPPVTQTEPSQQAQSQAAPLPHKA